MVKEKLKVLCVDDEPDLLDGLEHHLRKKYEVHTALGGEEGLEVLNSQGPFAIVLSDMRMPGMNGAEFLTRVREQEPNAVRMLLTGQTDLDAAVLAINEGEIFRFLTKPCPRDRLLTMFEQAEKQFRLMTAERELLEQTLKGSVEAMCDALALLNAASFGRAMRIKSYVEELCELLPSNVRWQVEVAAMFSQIGLVTAPGNIVTKLYEGRTLTLQEQDIVVQAEAATQGILNKIPRLEDVQSILHCQSNRDEEPSETIQPQVSALRIAADYELLERQGSSLQMAMDTMYSRQQEKHCYDDAQLEWFFSRRGLLAQQQQITELPVTGLRPGMILAEDIRTENGTVFASKGYEVNERFVIRAQNFAVGYIVQPIRVLIPATDDVEEVSAEQLEAA